MRSSNPVLKRAFETARMGWGSMTAANRSTVMTLQGTINKTLALSVLLVAGAGYAVWQMTTIANPYTLMWLSIGGGLVVALVTSFRPDWAPVTAPIYAVLEGIALGVISFFFEQIYPGIVAQAIGLTMSVFVVMLLGYKAGVIRATETFRSIVVSATMAIFVVYLMTWILRMFSWEVPYIHGSGIIGIVFSLIVVVVAALNLILDFDFIEQASEDGSMPKYMEWYAGFGLLVTLVWLYIEILKLLAKLRNDD
ncbi:MAG: Bax inhibitor-1/YccA family protein [Microscillaceae bacterium]|nr:Bax inhibitor-1/YccA family protein [Microscillaceae bacterium]MDW8459608.1 Bax inhibitor-1/YccA family protein [Cytophagales bacterium]